MSAPALELAAHERRAGGERGELRVAQVGRRPAEAAVGVERELLRRADLEDLANALRDVLRRILGEALHIHHARTELAPLAVRLPDVELGHLAAAELQHELLRARLQDSGEVRLVPPLEARAPEPVTEADVEAELGADAIRGPVEQARHLLAGDVAARRRVDLDGLGARRHEAAP